MILVFHEMLILQQVSIRKLQNNMRVRNYCSRSVRGLLFIMLPMIMTACSHHSPSATSNHPTNSSYDDSKNLSAKIKVPNQSTIDDKVNSKAIEASDDSQDDSHSHPSNPCTDAIAHSHRFTKKEHEHKYDCETTNEYTRNAHIHPATKKTRKFRHVHPNGSAKHVHHKE